MNCEHTSRLLRDAIKVRKALDRHIADCKAGRFSPLRWIVLQQSKDLRAAIKRETKVQSVL
jgi:hypothetical protein